MRDVPVGPPLLAAAPVPWSGPSALWAWDTCNFSPRCWNGGFFKEGLFTVEKCQTKTFTALSNREFRHFLVLTVGLGTAVLGPDLGPRTLKLFRYFGLPVSLKRLSRHSVKQLKRFIKFCRKLQNFKQAILCVLNGIVTEFPRARSRLMALSPNMRRCIYGVHWNPPLRHPLPIQLYIYSFLTKS